MDNICFFLSVFIPKSSFILYFWQKKKWVKEQKYSFASLPPAPMPMLIASVTISVTKLKLWSPIEETTVVQTRPGVLAAGYNPQNGHIACCEGRIKHKTRPYIARTGCLWVARVSRMSRPLSLVFASNKQPPEAHN